jgi:hypothetical protein
MSFANLLVQNGPFAFEHAMAHRYWMMALPLNQYSVVPYELDPMQNDPMWALNHQQAHTDSIATPPPLGPFGEPYPQNLIDTKFGLWWTFANHQSHLIGNDNMLASQWPLTPAW